MIVHFPIVLLFAAAGLYVAAMVRRHPILDLVAFVFHALGLVACLLAIFTGDFEAEKITTPAVQAIARQHEALVTYATYGFGLMGIWAFLRQKSEVRAERIAFLVCFIALTVLLAFGGRLGGKLVFEHGVGQLQATPSHVQGVAPENTNRKIK